MKCLDKCKEYEVSCPNKDCRLWIEFSPEHNCSLESIERSFDTESRPLTLEEVGKRLKLSFVRIKQIETKAIQKMLQGLE
tara:strand:+ start:822 stop:1061 length:240 start_codon:yes stop_codon:yes gene_type:complete